MQFLLAETGRGANRPPPAGSGTHQAGSLKILNDLVDGVDSVGQAGTGLQGGDRGGGVGLTGRAGRTGWTSRTGSPRSACGPGRSGRTGGSGSTSGSGGASGAGRPSSANGSGGTGRTSRAGRPGRSDDIRKVAITLENQGKNLLHYAKCHPWKPPGGIFVFGYSQKVQFDDRQPAANESDPRFLPGIITPEMGDITTFVRYNKSIIVQMEVICSERISIDRKTYCGLRSALAQ